MKLFARCALAASLTLAALPGLSQTLTYLGQQIVPTGTSFRGLPVGGLSSLDYVSATGHYLAICDDRSERGPARFSELTLDLAKAAGPYQAGQQEMKLAGYRRYVDEFTALAAAIRDGQQLAVSPAEELLVEETVLRACEML